MAPERIKAAQEFLTLVNDGRARRIIDIETLLNRHSESLVLGFLKDVLKEKTKILKGLIDSDRKNVKINETIAAMFRVYMAIKTIEDEKEVKAA
jgi:hypothetical protein